MAPAWRLARSLQVFRGEVNSRWAARDKRSDGTIGDAEHAARSSDHNPWLKRAGVGIVRAVDVDKDLTGPGTDARPAFEAHEALWLAEFLRALGIAGDPRLVGGGYVIWNRRIAGGTKGWAWRPYSGLNSHEHHVHLSVSLQPAGFDSLAPWGIWPNRLATPSSAPTPTREDDDLTPDQERKLDTAIDIGKQILRQLGGDYDAGSWPGWKQLGGRTLVDAVAALPADNAKALLGQMLTGSTWNNGDIKDLPLTVQQALTRAQEGSIAAHIARGEQVKK